MEEGASRVFLKYYHNISSLQEDKRAKIKRICGNVLFIASLLGSFTGILNLAANFNEEMIDNWLRLTAISLLQDLGIYQTFKTIVTIILKCILSKFSSSDSVGEEIIKMIIALFIIA